jgi:hypothetical protein
MSTSSPEPGILAYWRERMPPTLFVPVALFLALPSLSEGWSALAKSALVAYLLVLQFRLWDDLVDREREPERVLGRAPTLRPFYFLFGTVTAAVLLLDFEWTYVVALLVFALWYRWLSRNVHPVVCYHVVLLKYPLFTYVAASAGAFAMVLVYATIVAYEPLHDRSLRLAPVAVAGLLAWLALVALSTNAYLVLPAAAVAAAAVRQIHRGEDGTLAGRALFLVSFACLLFTEGAFS